MQAIQDRSRLSGSSRRRWDYAVLLAVMVLLGSGCSGAGTESVANQEAESDFLFPDDDESIAPTDSPGEGKAASRAAPATATVIGKSASADAAQHGWFGPVFSWPVIAIHAALIPDGRVLAFGTRSAASGVNALKYVVWNPAQGLGEDAFTTLPNSTGTNLFCAAQLVLPDSGDLLVVGGSGTDAYGRPNFGVANTNRFNPGRNELTRDSGGEMASRRWYPTVLTTADGTQLVLGGRDNNSVAASAKGPAVEGRYAPTPELLTARQGWRALPGASSVKAYGSANSFAYPRAWQAPNGKIFVLGGSGAFFYLDIQGEGSISEIAPLQATAPRATRVLPSVMYAPGRILALRGGGRAITIDLNGPAPTWTPTAMVDGARLHSSATVLPDGKVWLNGGGESTTSLVDADYQSQTWDPATGLWTTGAAAVRARLYHSTSLLLPDATVLTAGGGSPGPQTNLNGEIFYPPYLYKNDGSGELAERPQIMAAPQQQLGWGESFDLEVASATAISRVSLLRSGSATHSFNNEQRFLDLPFEQIGSTLRLRTPALRTLAPPGFYLLFVLDADGVPSIAKMIRLA